VKQLLFWVVGLCTWLSVFYNLERWNQPINIASFVYVYIAVVIAVVLLVRWFQRVPIYWTFLIALPPYFLLRILFGYQIGGSSLPITVTEISAIGITILLARQVGRRVEELQEAVIELTLGRSRNGTSEFSVDQGQIYREIRRARRYHRPAALMAVCATNESMKVSLHRFIQEAQREITRKYVSARMASFLVRELDDFDIITERDDHFIVLLPELSRKSLPEVIDNLKKALSNNLGLDAKIGVSMFPDEAVTLESLVEKATVAMDQDLGGPSDTPRAPAESDGAGVAVAVEEMEIELSSTSSG
jgi:GGDEF domain-containing protein